MSLQQKILGTIKKLTHGNPTIKAKFEEANSAETT
jgi:hypothetical protein